jgi:SAM-dependent methyltransferase
MNPSTDPSGPSCRSCGRGGPKLVLSLGETPLADVLVTEAGLAGRDLTVPLDLVFCPRCRLVQITETVSPEILFAGEYPYFASVSTTRSDAARRLAHALIERFRLGPGGLVIEPGSNDGYLLRHFVEKGIGVLGIDPARPPAQEAVRIGVPTRCDFFTLDLARGLRREGTAADVVVGNNVLAHVADLNGFVEGTALLLKDDGVFVAEVAYLVDMLAQSAFDTIYHQHLCYFSILSLDALFRRHGLEIFDVDRLEAQGGSLRVYVGRNRPASRRLEAMREEEERLGIATGAAYGGFKDRVEGIREDLRALLADLKGAGRRIAGYGAAAKATTLLSYDGIGRDVLDYVVDLNAFKQGRYLPGVRLKICPPSRLLEDKPDDVLLLAWNYESEVRRQEASYLEGGGRFIVPIPRPRVA